MRSEWTSYKIGEIFELVNGYAFKSSDFISSGIPVLKIKNVKPNNVVLDDLSYVSVEVASRRNDKAIRRGDILITMSGNRFDGSKDTWVGKVAYFDISGHYMLNQRVGVLRPREGVVIDRKCAAYFLSSDDYQKLFISIATSSGGQANLSPAQILGEQLHLPPIEEQARISELLGGLDDRITLLRETNATLEAIAQALFKSWFVDFDPVHAKAEGRARQDGERSGQPRMPQASDLPRPGAEAGAEAQGQPEAMDATTAALFPDSFEESELGLVPKGWAVSKFGDFINRLPVGQKYDQKSAFPEGRVPVLDQGKSGIIGYHNDSPGVKASLEDPVVVFANHTCYMRLITFDFSAIQNVLPFNGRGVDTVWAFYATKDRVKFSEYKGHWPDFAIEKSVLPPAPLTYAFRDVVDPVIRKIRFNELQAQTLTQLRDTLLPRLISGQLRLPEAEATVEEVL